MSDVASSAWIAPGAHVGGAVRLGDDVSVWYGAAVRAEMAEIVIGARSNVQDNAVIHVDEGFGVQLGEDVTIGHGAIVHGCSVGANTVIGMGSIVLNDAKVGENCIVGAGALVTQGMVIPAGSVAFGSPARVVRAIRPEEIEANRRNADHYVELARAQR